MAELAFAGVVARPHRRFWLLAVELLNKQAANGVATFGE